MTSPLNRACLVCGASFQLPPSANWPGKYCSRDCRDRGMTTIPDSSCVTCGGAVHPPKGTGRRVRGKKYCSRACYAVAMKGRRKVVPIMLPCRVCGTEKEVKPYRVKFYRYCSKQCQILDLASKAATPELDRLRRSAAYKQWRSKVFERDSYTCVICGDRNLPGRGESVVLQADHIKPFAHFPELRFDIDNGRTLCGPCHRATPTYGGRSRKRIAVPSCDTAGY